MVYRATTEQWYAQGSPRWADYPTGRRAGASTPGPPGRQVIPSPGIRMTPGETEWSDTKAVASHSVEVIATAAPSEIAVPAVVDTRVPLP